ncbi:MAG TPA: PAS domain S-box protein [Steroidobacteraceae bacterium]|nr:PAS domain S-box protein [Steroidobacteraceae bacterium]
MRAVPPELARSALEAAPDAMLIVDASGIIRYANRQVSALFGYEHDEFIGQSVEMLMPARFRSRHVGHREHFVENVRVRSMGAGLELFGQRSDGTEFALEISLSPIEDTGRTLIAAAIRDVTDRKKVEAELIVARDAAQAMRELAERANAGKSRFLATASHDLRQPLQALAMLNGSLRRSITDPRAAEALSQQEQAISGMSKLLNTLLDISKLESGAIHPEPTDFVVSALFAELRSEFASVASSKGLVLEVDTCEHAVHSDPSLVEQILRNLVSNAIKYTYQGVVRLRCLHEASFVRIEVLDTGIGIPSDQMSHIYDEFYQIGVPANSTRDGYGLGLNIVQRLVTLLNLKLDVRSEIGKGSAFSLVLPGGESHAAPAQINFVGGSHLPQKQMNARVLLVEDNASVMRATRTLLEMVGYDVTPAVSLAEAMRYAHGGNRIDIVVTDFHLSDGETGSHVIAALRAEFGESLRALLMTGDTSAAIKQLPRDEHLRVLSKPIDPDALLASLHELLSS